MDFLDRTLLRLLDPTERATIFTPAIGDRALSAAFEARNIEIGAATGVVARDVDLLPDATSLTELRGTVTDPMSGTRWDLQGSLDSANPTTAAHAIVDLRVTTEIRRAASSIESVDTAILAGLADAATVDARIVAEDGALPAGLEQLDRRRYVALKAELLDRLTIPGDVDIDVLGERLGGGTFTGLMAALGAPNHLTNVAVEIVVDGSLPAFVATHRVIAGVRIEEDPIAELLDVLERVKLGASALAGRVEPAPPPDGMVARRSLPFVVIFPEETLDDVDLPIPAGSNPGTALARRAAHLTELQTRLIRSGIALAPIPA